MTFGEGAGVLVGTLLGTLAYLFGTSYATLRLPDVGGTWGLLLWMLVVMLVPSFLAAALAMLPTSSRHRPLAGTITLFVLVGFAALDAASSLRDGFWGFLGAATRFSVSMIGALLALTIVRRIRWRKATRAPGPDPADLARAERMPQVPAFLLFLSVVSVPVSILALALSMFVSIGLVGLLFSTLTETEGVPLFVLIGAGIALLAGVGSTFFTLVSLLRRPRPVVGGRRADGEAFPGLRDLLAEVSTRVGTRMPDHVLVVPEPQFYVTQSRLKTSDGTLRGRTLVLGLPLISVMETDELAAILAHESGHFQGRDLVFSMLAMPVYQGLGMAVATLQGTQAVSDSGLLWIIRLLVMPQLHFLLALQWYFHALNMILSRRRELRADWISARCFGTNAASSALRTADAAGRAFNDAAKSLPTVDPEGIFAAWAQRWRQIRSTGFNEKPVAEPESEFDSHPSLAVRLAVLPYLSAAPLKAQPDLMTELAEVAKKVSQDFAPVLKKYQQQSREAAREASGTTVDDVSADEPAIQPSLVPCRKCGVEVVPTFHGCCPRCDEPLK